MLISRLVYREINWEINRDSRGWVFDYSVIVGVIVFFVFLNALLLFLLLELQYVDIATIPSWVVTEIEYKNVSNDNF